MPADERGKAIQLPPMLTDDMDIDWTQYLSSRVVPTLKDKAIRIPGFIVPMEMNDDNQVTEFFLVPYFGACVHYPPPPPNQIIYVRMKQAVEHEKLYSDAFWLKGILKTSGKISDIAASAYSMEGESIELYDE